MEPSLFGESSSVISSHPPWFIQDLVKIQENSWYTLMKKQRRFRGFRPSLPQRESSNVAYRVDDSISSESSMSQELIAVMGNLPATDASLDEVVAMTVSHFQREKRRQRLSHIKGGGESNRSIDVPPAALPSDESLSCTSSEGSDIDFEVTDESQQKSRSFLKFRLNYLLVTLVIMLADGLQGTHLYVLYEGYGFSVASLYCLGFITGAITAPVTGPIIDRFGRKKSAILYCILEIGINMLEQYPFLVGLIASRMIGGITTNLLSSVFETWLDTEYRLRGFDKAEYEVIMRDSVVVSNLAAIASGYIAHILAEKLGPVGPFEGAVSCTAIALVVVLSVWTENYGSRDDSGEQKSITTYMADAIHSFRSDTKVLRVGIIQGLTMGSIQIFVFLWSPALQGFARHAPEGVSGLDGRGDPAYGLIFGTFMAAGVLGGLCSPILRKFFTFLLTPPTKNEAEPDTIIIGGVEERPMAVEFLAAFCYILCATLLLVPCIISESDVLSFSTSLGAFVLYEFLVGLYLPCEGVIRSLYIPSDSRASMMTLPCIIVNVAVSLGVVSTKFVSMRVAFAAIACLMATSAVIQLSLVSKREWDSLFDRFLLPFQSTLQGKKSSSSSRQNLKLD